MSNEQPKATEKQQPVIGITPEMLDKILERQDQRQLEMLRELKKPTALEQKELDKQAKEQQQAQEARKQDAAQIRKIHQDKVTFQTSGCTHRHRKDNTPRVVLVAENEGPGYLLCQKCQAVIRSGDKPKEYTGNAIYNTALFNQLFQSSGSSGIID